MFLRFWHQWRARFERRRSMGFLLHRHDDHLLRDIGLDRDALNRLLDRQDA